MATNEKYIKDGKEIKRQPCEIYTRVMWYLRPVSAYNIWKRSEFYNRKYYRSGCECNRDFISKYSSVENSHIKSSDEYQEQGVGDSPLILLPNLDKSQFINYNQVA